MKRSVFAVCNRGCPALTVARDYGIGIASVERFCHHAPDLENRKIFPVCPRIPGIDGDRFPNAMVGLDRFHVIRLVNERFRQFLTELDDESLSCNRGGAPDAADDDAGLRLASVRKTRLEPYFQDQPAIGILYGFWYDLNDLLRSGKHTMAWCKGLIPGFPGYLQQLITSPFELLKTLGKTFPSWTEDVSKCFGSAGATASPRDSIGR